ncbi:MAG: DNA-formamidopyrimidine glycosylase family protein [Patulibacter sp.]
MPEGDTIANAAQRLRPILLGAVPQIDARHPPLHSWPQRLAGRSVTAIDTHGKHLFVRFEGELAIHSHLRMTGAWQTGAIGERWGRAPRRAWLILRAGDHEAVQFDGPVLELLTGLRARSDRRLARLGPDILAADFDEREFLRRLRADDPTRPFGDALLDQSIVAGLGNIWRAEACFDAALSPWHACGEVSDEQALAAIRAVRPRMAASARSGARHPALHIYLRTRCTRCGGPVSTAGMGDDNRTAYWCPTCQR